MIGNIKYMKRYIVYEIERTYNLYNTEFLHKK